MAERTQGFISYSHRDTEWLKRLQIYLKPLEDTGKLSLWDDSQIPKGMKWRDEIARALARARVAVLLVSDAFLASDFITRDELPVLLKAAEQDGARILPVIVSPCRYERTPVLKEFQAVNPPARTLEEMEPAEWKRVLLQVSELIEDCFNPQSTPSDASGTAPGGRWYVPLRPSPFFTGREVLLTCLHEALQGWGAVALTGLGGIGKTQAALAYAYDYRQNYSTVLWVRAATRDELVAGFTTLATVLVLPERNASEQAQSVAAVQRWLEQSTDWLLILDNADDLSLVREFLPVRRSGRLLVTTRAAATGEVAEAIEVERLPPEVGALFLLRRAKRLAREAPLATASREDQAAARTLTEELGGLPLALDQAGAYLEEMQLTPGEYLPLYQQVGQKLRARRGELAADHQSVAVTFSLAFAQVAAASPAAAELLRLCAFLHPSGIPEEMLIEGASELGPVLGPVLMQPLGLIDIRREASQLSLLHRDPYSRTLLIHPMVQAVLRDELEAAAQHDCMKRAIRLVNLSFPSVNFEVWSQCERLLPQALVCTDAILQRAWTSVEAVRLLNETARYLYERARYKEAEPLLRRALAIREQALGDHLDTAQSLNNLADLYNAQGRYEEAESLYWRALAIQEQALGDHPDTAQSLNNLAGLYERQACYEKTEPLLRRALLIFEQMLGPNHPTTALCLDNLAVLYNIQSCYGEAERLHQRALPIIEQALGPNHPTTAFCLDNLAGLYEKQDRYKEAEPLLRRALAIREQALGNHPDTAQSLNNLADFHNAQGRYEEAESLYQRALLIFEQMLGPNHPTIAASCNNLAGLYERQGRYKEAEPLLRRALAIREQALGPNHLHTASSCHNLAGLCYKWGRYEEAEPLYRRALAIREQALGDHPDTATNLNNLARLYERQGRYEEAEPLYRRALAIREQTLGPNHPDTAQSLNDLAELYRAQGRYKEAEPLRRRALAIREQALGPDHPGTAASRNDLAKLYRAQGRYKEAEPLRRRALAIREQALGDHLDTAQSLNDLAELYRAQGRYKEAEPLRRRALAIVELMLGPAHPTAATVRANYADLSEAMKH